MIDLSLGPGPAAVAVDDSADVRQPDAGPLELVRAVQPLENAKELAGVFRVKTGAVVPPPMIRESCETIALITKTETSASIAAIIAGFVNRRKLSVLSQPPIRMTPAVKGRNTRIKRACVDSPIQERSGQLSGPQTEMIPMPRIRKAIAVVSATGMTVPPYSSGVRYR